MDYMLLLPNELTRKGSSFSLSPKFPQATWPLTPAFLKSLFLISFSARKTRQIPFGSHQWSSSSHQKKLLKSNKVPFKSDPHPSCLSHSTVLFHSCSLLHSSWIQSLHSETLWKESQDYSRCHCRVHLKGGL